MNEHYVAKDIDAVVPVLFWTPVEFVVAITAMAFGFILNSAGIGILCCFFVLLISSKMKRGNKRGFMQHLLWRMGVAPNKKLKSFPGPLRIEFIE